MSISSADAGRDAGEQQRRGWSTPVTSAMAVTVLALALGVWTLGIVLIPELRFTMRSPHLRIRLDVAALLVAAMAAAVAYLRWSITGSVRSLLMGLGFVAISANNLVFGQLVAPARGYEGYAWSAGRLMLIGSVIAAALVRTDEGPVPDHPFRDFAVYALTVALVLGAVQSILVAAQDVLPPVEPLPSDQLIGLPLDLVPTHLAIGVAGAVLYGVAIVLLLWKMPELSVWFVLALVMGAYAHLHYALMPTAFTEHVSTGDALRVGFSAAILLAMLGELKRGYLVERERATLFSREVEVERRRVDELQEVDRAKVELVRMLSHELMHPVAAMRTMAAALRIRWSELPEQDRLGLVRAMDSESKQLSDLVDAAPTIVDPHEDPFPVQPRRLEVRELLGRMATTLRPSSARVRLEVDPFAADAIVDVDPARITQVLQNLLANADVHARTPEPVVVRVGLGDDAVEVRVHDEGPGIPPERAAHLFERPNPTETNGNGGMGFGLYISRRIVEAHGGKIWLDDAEPSGATLAFSMPVTAPAKADR